jgi:UDP-3-O-[3-hydroxymyristoyl] glucosamine N-acyltransferase
MKFNTNIYHISDKLKKFDILPEKDFVITGVSSTNKPKSNTLIYINKDSNIKNLNDVSNCLVIVYEEIFNQISMPKDSAVLLSKNPRLDYALYCEELVKLNTIKKTYDIRELNVVVGVNSFIHSSVVLEPNVFIDENVEIGENTLIQSGAKIYSNVSIGANCIIGANTTIGLYGFGVEKDESGATIRIPQLGGVVIGNNVQISSLCNIHSGTIDPTVLNDYVQLDSMVHIAHNCEIGRSTLITACSEISGSVKMGENCYIGPNSSIINKITLGSNVVVGLGSVVTKSFDSNSIIAGSPADHTINLKKNKEILTKLLKERETTDER